MYEIKDLFDRRSVVGAKIEVVMEQRKYTKTQLCKGAHISRPTIDKVLAGTITNKTTYEKHMMKILTYLKLTPDMLLGNIMYSQSNVRSIRNLMRLTTKEISQATDIPLNRLNAIEAGGEASVAELRDIACCLSVSTHVLCGKNIFEPQSNILSDLITIRPTELQNLHGFWGHLGIIIKNSTEPIWYPITDDVRNFLYQINHHERIVIPCINNKVLYLNIKNIKEMILLDEACDAPSHVAGDHKVSNGEIPLAVYEALEDCWLEEGEAECLNGLISPRLQDYIKKLLENNHWNFNDIKHILFDSTIYYDDGKNRNASIVFDEDSAITSEFFNMYNFHDLELSDDIVSFEDMDGSETFLNLQHIAMIESPLLKVEEGMIKIYDEIGNVSPNVEME